MGLKLERQRILNFGRIIIENDNKIFVTIKCEILGRFLGILVYY